MSETAHLLSRQWDAVVVGAGHNGLTCAAYLARAGQSVLVLERRDQIGGACTLDRPFSDQRYVVSPCAYLVGLLHPLVVEELDLRRRGLRVHLVDPHLFCPFDDGTSLTLWDDDDKSAAAIAAIAPGDVEGYLAYSRLFSRLRDRLRSPARDTWLGDPPDRAEIEELLGHDPQAIDVVFEASIADVVESHVRDERLRTALHGQGVIGTWAGPRDAGTAFVHLMHSLGTTEGKPGAWGYVEGGMGRVAEALAEAAAEAGAAVVTGVTVASVTPGEGVSVEGGEFVRARVVVSNADPKRTLALVGAHAPAAWRSKVEEWRIQSPVMKVNCALRALPTFPSDEQGLAHRAMVTVSGGIDETQRAFEACRAGEPAPAWCELYFHTAYDPSVAPPSKHTMSVFAQYVPALEGWDSQREAVGDIAVAAIRRFAPGIEDVIEEREVLGPPDIEARIGLSGGHIFQGDCLPTQMWDRRFRPRTGMPALYLCGAATHPGGSVMAVNGRNAAMAVLADLRSTGA